MFTRIVTHPGPAHRDDFVACCIALATYESINLIERREPTPDDLNDPECLVFDVGEQHDPSLGNFDHHHFPRETPPTCCLSLFLQHLGLYEQFKLLDWMDATEIRDSRGPNGLASHLRCGQAAILKNMSPIEGVILSLFKTTSRLDEEDRLWGLMLRMGVDFVQHAQAVSLQVETLKATAELFEVSGIPVMLIHTDDLRGVSKFREIHCPGVAISISHSNRGEEGWSFFRYDDDPRVDFSRIESEDDIIFAHKNGFLAKMSSLAPIGRVKELIEKAIV